VVDTVHGDQVPVSQGRQASFNSAIRAENVQITRATFDAQPEVIFKPREIEERLQLDTALPKRLSAFYVVIAVRELDAPTVAETR